MRGKSRAGILKTGKTFAEAAEQFLRNTPLSRRGSAARNGLRATAYAYGCTSSPSLATSN